MGFFYSILSSAAFGLIPLFTLPLMHGGVSGPSALFYRFAIATVVLGIVLAVRGERFSARGIDLCKLAAMSSMYTMAALLFFWGFKHMPSGVVATLQFTYPVMVMLIMIVFYHERFSWITALSILLAIAGVYLLCGGNDGDMGGATLLAVVTAVISNLTLILAVQRIGSTLTSILGVMEPVTAVVVGILVFSEPFSMSLVAGVAFIAASVILVMLGKQITALFQRHKHA